MRKNEMLGFGVALASAATLAAGCSSSSGSHESAESKAAHARADILSQMILSSLSQSRFQPEDSVAISPSSHEKFADRNGQHITLTDSTDERTTVTIDRVVPNPKIAGSKNEYITSLTINEPTSTLVHNQTFSRVMQNLAAVSPRDVTEVLLQSYDCNTVKACASDDAFANANVTTYTFSDDRYENKTNPWEKSSVSPQFVDEQKVLDELGLQQ